jgi:hypothetical protein
MKKRVSKRRWKARCAIGRLIPEHAILSYGLDRWFYFDPVGDANPDVYRARWMT